MPGLKIAAETMRECSTTGFWACTRPKANARKLIVVPPGEWTRELYRCIGLRRHQEGAELGGRRVGEIGDSSHEVADGVSEIGWEQAVRLRCHKWSVAIHETERFHP